MNSTTLLEPKAAGSATDHRKDAIQLTDQQLQQYREEGYTVVRGLISTKEAQRVRSQLMDLQENNSDWPKDHFHVVDPTKFKNSKGEFLVLGVQTPARRDPVFQAIADHSNLQDAMTQLLGGPVKRFTDQALIKSRLLRGESFYHQDSYYWRIKPKLGCNAWIALDEVGKDAIALGILPGTHKEWTLAPHENYFDEPPFHTAGSGEAFKRHRIPRDQIDFAKEVLLSMSPGDAAFFTNYTWHRAEPNLSGVDKCAYAIAYRLIEEAAG